MNRTTMIKTIKRASGLTALLFVFGTLDATSQTLEGATDGCYTRQELTARSQGFLDRVFVKEGTMVEAGTVIAELDNRLLGAALKEAGAAVAAAKANVDLARDSLSRLDNLKDSDAVTPQELVQARIKTRQAEAQWRGARAILERTQIQYEDTIIRAAINGRVSGVPQVKGLFVQAGQSLGRVEGQPSSCSAETKSAAAPTH